METSERGGGPKVGFVLWHEQFRTPDLVEFAVLAERAGFDEVWTSDHFHPWQDNQGHAMQAWVTLVLVGARTSRIGFGTAVTCPTVRYHPAVVAQTFASLGVLYPGRIFLGVGTGEALNEQAATGWWAPYPERAERWVEAIDLIRQLWSGDWVRFEGKHYQTSGKLYDVPEQMVPIQMAARGPNSARLAGQHGDGWITGAADLEKPELMEAFRAGARAAGKNPAALPVRVETAVCVGDEAEAKRVADLLLFQKHAWEKELLWEPDPRHIEAKARQQTTPEELIEEWASGCASRRGNRWRPRTS